MPPFPAFWLQQPVHAAEASEYTKYAPLGTPGAGSGRAFAYGAYHTIDESFYLKTNDRIRCHIMIETAGALLQVNAIAALPTVDGFFVGFDVLERQDRSPHAASTFTAVARNLAAVRAGFTVQLGEEAVRNTELRIARQLEMARRGGLGWCLYALQV
jgi:4-hydroxy-2-oxoheptanedioate aldolase